MNEDSVDFNQNIRDLEELGITVVPDVISKSTCEEFIGRCEALCDMYIRQGRRLNAEGQFINSPFRFDDRFLSLLEIPVLFPILSQVLDPDFVVINSNIINNRLRQDIVSTGDKIGGTWHTDSRYLGDVVSIEVLAILQPYCSTISTNLMGLRNMFPAVIYFGIDQNVNLTTSTSIWSVRPVTYLFSIVGCGIERAIRVRKIVGASSASTDLGS